jgi:hypothetical protein
LRSLYSLYSVLYCSQPPCSAVADKGIFQARLPQLGLARLTYRFSNLARKGRVQIVTHLLLFFPPAPPWNTIYFLKQFKVFSYKFLRIGTSFNTYPNLNFPVKVPHQISIRPHHEHSTTPAGGLRRQRYVITRVGASRQDFPKKGLTKARLNRRRFRAEEVWSGRPEQDAWHHREDCKLLSLSLSLSLVPYPSRPTRPIGLRGGCRE